MIVRTSKDNRYSTLTLWHTVSICHCNTPEHGAWKLGPRKVTPSSSPTFVRRE